MSQPTPTPITLDEIVEGLLSDIAEATADERRAELQLAEARGRRLAAEAVRDRIFARVQPAAAPPEAEG